MSCWNGGYTIWQEAIYLEGVKTDRTMLSTELTDSQFLLISLTWRLPLIWLWQLVWIRWMCFVASVMNIPYLVVPIRSALYLEFHSVIKGEENSLIKKKIDLCLLGFVCCCIFTAVSLKPGIVQIFVRHFNIWQTMSLNVQKTPKYFKACVQCVEHMKHVFNDIYIHVHVMA